MSKMGVVLLWHMHQPFYSDLWTGDVSLPWVRLHGSKSYNDMAAAIEKTPAKVVVNFTGSLLYQLRRLAEGYADTYFNVARKPVDSLSDDERASIINNSFSVSVDTMVKPNPRYRELWTKRREENWRPGDEVHQNYTTAELRDLIFYFHLAWTGWDARDNYPDINEIAQKGWGYSEDEKNFLLDTGMEVVNKVLPRYKKLYDAGIIELTTTSYAHPIVPLLIDSNIARRSQPHSTLPEQFKFPQDAEEHVRQALDLFESVFGRKPVGMWPSEGSVCPEIIPILAKYGIKYFLTDQGILWKSDGVNPHSMAHYYPYAVEHEGQSVSVFFRDTKLSDLVGFDYARMVEHDAALDMVGRLKNVAISTAAWEIPSALTIALDGENAWENYKEGGKSFLHRLYSEVNTSGNIEFVLPSERIMKYPPVHKIKTLHSGSWIRSDFSIWIGGEEENDAWNLLGEIRKDYETFKPAPAGKFGGGDIVTTVAYIASQVAPALSKLELLAAEGSDWFWWYGDDFTSDNDQEFDRLFRKHIENVYNFLGKTPPEKLTEPILKPHQVRPDCEPVAFVHPSVDGRVTDFYEWNDGGMYTVRASGGAMYTRDVFLEKIFFGFDRANWYLRLDPKEQAWNGNNGVNDRPNVVPDVVIIECIGDKKNNFRIEIPAHSSVNLPCNLYFGENTSPELLSAPARASADKVMEIIIPFQALHLAPGMELKFTILLERAGRQLDRYPPAGYLSFSVPDADFERRMWSA